MPQEEYHTFQKADDNIEDLNRIFLHASEEKENKRRESARKKLSQPRKLTKMANTYLKSSRSSKNRTPVRKQHHNFKGSSSHTESTPTPQQLNRKIKKSINAEKGLTQHQKNISIINNQEEMLAPSISMKHLESPNSPFQNMDAMENLSDESQRDQKQKIINLNLNKLFEMAERKMSEPNLNSNPKSHRSQKSQKSQKSGKSKKSSKKRAPDAAALRKKQKKNNADVSVELNDNLLEIQRMQIPMSPEVQEQKVNDALEFTLNQKQMNEVMHEEISEQPKALEKPVVKARPMSKREHNNDYINQYTFKPKLNENSMRLAQKARISQHRVSVVPQTMYKKKLEQIPRCNS